MSIEKYGPESTVYDLRDLRPEKPARTFKPQPVYRDAAKSGYTCLARRPLSNLPGEWTDLETADRIDNINDSLGPYPLDY